MSYHDRETAAGPKKLLSLDGGGIRGVLTLEILAQIERVVQRELRRDNDFVLADYFDYVAGTSTGAVIASGIALGMRVERISQEYESLAHDIFARSRLWQRAWAKYRSGPLTEQLKRTIGSDTTLGSDKLKTLLMVVMREQRTDSPWPVSNNTRAKYNLRSHEECNLDYPLWQLVRASTAAPTFFPAEELGQHLFVDGGVTTFNDPAFQLFLMATLDAYKLGWPTGEDKLLLVSVGTGYSAAANKNLRRWQMNLVYNAKSVPAALMFAAMNQQDALCRVFGACRVGNQIDSEVGALKTEQGALREKLFAYARLNADLSPLGLKELKLEDVDPNGIAKMDSVDRIADLRRVGRAVADRDVRPELFTGFLA